MSERTKDPMILFKSVKKTVNEAGKLHVALSMNKEETIKLIEALTTLIETGAERGLKLDVHVSKKESQDGRTFDSAIAFVKVIQDPAAFAGGGATGAAKRFSSTPTKGYDVTDKLAAARAKLSKTVTS